MLKSLFLFYEVIDMKNNIGVIGMAVMGSNLALNMADHGFKVSVYNRTEAVTREFVEKSPHENITPFYSLEEFVQSLAKPRKVLMMIKAGKPVDVVIDQLIPLMDKGDIIIDAGNSFFEDTRRRNAYVEGKGLIYFGVGVSGGEEGARRGPAIMPGGDADSYKEVGPILEAISAHVGDSPCCTYIGTDGAGHYVKMVHNGIEYADMQLIAESYLMLKNLGGIGNEQMADIFAEWNEGELKSYLIGITAKIMKEKDDLGKGQLVDKILDSAGQKGTGRWTSIQALKQGVDTSMITAACNARVMSNQLAQRQKIAGLITAPDKSDVPDDFVEKVRQSLYTAKIIAYTQGFSLYRSAAKEYGWDLDFGKIAAIFRGGCIIQAVFLNKITEAYEKNPDLENLMLDDFFLAKIKANVSSLREIVAFAMKQGIPVPAMANALEYLDGMRSRVVGANLIQAQRDFFGAHTYQRNDREGTFHHDWPEE